MAEQQLRIYDVRPGHLDDFVAVWRRQIVPLRVSAGYKILAAWADYHSSTFCWLVGWAPSTTLGELEAKYKELRAAESLDPDPAQWVESARLLRASPVPLND